jgi:hypothetical protein
MRDEDWDRLVRAFRIRVVLQCIGFDEGSASIILRDGRVLSGHQTTWFRDPEDELVGLPELVQAAMQQAMPTWDEGARVKLSFQAGAFQLLLGDEEYDVDSITCVPRRNDLEWADMHISNPKDFVFIKVLPNEIVAEKRFFEFAELDRLSEQF